MKRLFRNKVVVLSIAMLVLATFMVGAGGQKESAAKQKKYLIGEIIYNLSQPYQQAHAKNAELYAKEIGVDIIIVDGKGSAATAASAMEDLIAKKVDGIIIQPADAESINVSVDEALSKGVAVVTFFNKPTKAKAPFVKLEEHDIASQMGEFAVKKWKEFHPDIPVRVGIIDEPAVDYTHTHRAGAFADGVLKADPTAKIVARLDGMGVRDKSLKAGEDLLQSHPEVNIIYGINNDSVLGALAAFEAGGRGKAVNGVPQTEIFFGTDGTEAEILKIANPNSSFKVTMALQPKNNARTLIDTLMKVIKKEMDMRSDYEIKSMDFIVDGWRMDIDKLQTFLKDQYFSTVDLRKAVGQ